MIVVDYGIGNIHSVVKALRYLGASVDLSAEPEDLLAADRVVLPGVGAFADGMRGLRQRNLVAPLQEIVRKGRPLLGICLGMQMLLSESEEFGRHEGLGIIAGKNVAILPTNVKVPHVGWNRISPRPHANWQGTIFEDLHPGAMVYFVHSFTGVPIREEDRLADALYGGQRISAAIAHDNVMGCQFHPEKSGPIGLAILRRFLVH